MYLPERTKKSIDDYVQNGLKPGGFITAVLANDLMGAFGRADMENRACMFEISSYVYNEIPSNCHGSYETVYKWINNHKEQKTNNED